MLKLTISKKLNTFQLNASFQVSSGITGIIGPSGCGKSVTLQSIAGLISPDKGEIIINEKPVFQSANRLNEKPKDRKIGYVFQNYALFPHLTVEKNIEYGLKGINSIEKKKKVADIMEKVQLGGYENHYPSQLSGGQQQRVALARTLVTEPELLLLDEPFSALDSQVKHTLEQELLYLIKSNFSGTVLLVTHDMEEAYRLCDNIILMDNGSIIQVGKKDEVFKKPRTVESAKIIGCENILKIDSFKDGSTYIECVVNNILLKVSKVKKADYRYLGLYANNIKFVATDYNGTNTFPYTISSVVSGIHYSQVNLIIEKAFTLHANVPNDQLQLIAKEDCMLYIHPNDLLLLE
ncbi:sulfate/molybdate ABC transporter ATP-binding protein [Bacillus alkalisoli]|uniref:sulfate/molybdate ABC transporter ATP-binding protein n=1 Tax=Bacillus alkalisoli TaxID=2011008 RepID=UPI000C246B1B|nr:ABC transporter ATP-binding protein [Bacillus alkalisoli]